jgi:hypothetical protein
LTEMNKCRHCGVFVPIEKAFCPNCSEPIEPEEAPNRAASVSTDLMATMRDEPENYKELLALKKQVASPQAQKEESASDTVSASTAPSAVGYNQPAIAPDLAPVKSNKRNLMLGIGVVSFLILLLVILLILKVI